MYVFVVLATHISENTVMTEVRGVFTHITEALPYVAALRTDGYLVRVQKHNVYSAPEPTRPLSMGGVQAVSAQPGATGQVAGLVQQALNSIGQHDTTRYCDTPEMAEAVGYLSQARALLA